jgi:Na+:H+ antiporter
VIHPWHWIVSAKIASSRHSSFCLRPLFKQPQGSWKVMTCGGLRGGISVALALSLPLSTERNTVVALTYSVVVFSVLAQGLSIGHVTRKSLARH